MNKSNILFQPYPSFLTALYLTDLLTNALFFIIRAEAPNGHCEWKGEGVDKPWCERDAPTPPSRLELETYRACNDKSLLPPWCQRGPLVPRISPRTSNPAVLKVRPDDCPARNIANEKIRSGPNGCNRPCQAPARQKFSLKNCNESYQSPPKKHFQSNGCFETNPNPRTEPVGCFTDLRASRNNINARVEAEYCYEEPRSANSAWCEQDVTASVRVGAAPQQDTSRYNQPNQYLQQVSDVIFYTNQAVLCSTWRLSGMRH